MIPCHFFIRLPPSHALLVLATLFRLSVSQVLARETMMTTTVQVHTLDVVPWPLTPTQRQTRAPASTPPVEFHRRASYNTICGYIGGDPALPATCMAGSHCAVHVQHGAVGCCPDGDDCISGIFTDCVDKNSGPQTLEDPYIFTCADANVCYRNTFDGGYYQYGCGTASDLATTVATTASHRTALELSRMTADLTALPKLLATPTTIGSTESEHGSTNDSLVPTVTLEISAPNWGRDPAQIPAVVGGVVGGLALLAALVFLINFLRRRYESNAPEEPGPGPDMDLMVDGPHDYEPLPLSRVVSQDESPEHPPPAYTSHDVSPVSSHGGVGASPPQGDGASIRDGSASVEVDLVPLAREVDDLESFRADNGASRLDDDDAHNVDAYPGPRRSGGGVLWQQNRRQNRTPA